MTIGHDTLFFDTGHERAIKANGWKWHEATNDESAIYEMVELELGAYLRDLSQDKAEQQDYRTKESKKADELKKALENWQNRINPKP